MRTTPSDERIAEYVARAVKILDPFVNPNRYLRQGDQRALDQDEARFLLAVVEGRFQDLYDEQLQAAQNQLDALEAQAAAVRKEMERIGK